MYRVAQICPNGHVATAVADQYPARREKFCSRCGETTMMQCSICNAPIRGEYYVPGYFGASTYTPPPHCHNCGSAFPWTDRAITGAVELLAFDGTLTESEIKQCRTDLTELTKDSPKTQVASLRFKNLMKKVGRPVMDGVRGIVVEVLSEAAKKAIWGG